MQSVPALEAQLADVRNLIAEDEKRLGQLRAAKALDSMSDDEQAELRTVRQRIRDRGDELADLAAALEVAEAWAQSEAGKKRRAEAVDAVLRAEAIAIAMREAAALEDSAGAAYEHAMGRRTALQAALRDQARQFFTLVQPDTVSQRGAEQLGHLVAATDSSFPQATAWRLAKLLGGAKGLVVLGPGASFDAQARLTAAGAAGVAWNGLRVRLASLLQAVGIDPPEQGLQTTRAHGARIAAAAGVPTTTAEAA